MAEKKNLILEASAVLFWLPVGENVDASFDGKRLTSPPSANPEPWFMLREALSYAMTAERGHNKQPWIKTNDQILDPPEIRKMWVAAGSKTFPPS